MTGYKDYLTDLVEKESHQKVKLGDDYQYPIKGVGEASYKLESIKQLKMKDVLYMLGLEKNLLSISGLEKKVSGLLSLMAKSSCGLKERPLMMLS